MTIPNQGTCGVCHTGYSLVPPYARCQCGNPRDATPWGDPRPTVEQGAKALRAIGRRVGVPPIAPERLARAMGERPVASCHDCRRLGHICRPCRKARYEARQRNQHKGVSDPAALVTVFFVFGFTIIMAAFAWRLIYG